MSYYREHNAQTYVDRKGYERFADSGTLVSRWVAERKLGRKLYNGEVVHHKDRNKLNNSRENLWVFRNQYEHSKAHRYDAEMYGYGYSYGSRR
jgi:HNH endonuclease